MAKYMKAALSLVLVILATNSYSLEKADSTKSKLKAGASFSLNSNGIASIPAFSLGDPAVIAAVNLAKGRFSYDPVLAYDMNLRPWFIDNWFNFKLINRPTFELRAGLNISSFFSDVELSDTVFLQGQRYFAFAMTGIYKFSPTISLLLSYWNDRGQDPGSLKGHYINLQGDKTDIPIGKHVLLAVGLQLFYINYDGSNDGLFLSPRLASSVRNFPISIFFQAIQPLTTNVEPNPGFRWNIGVAYTL